MRVFFRSLWPTGLLLCASASAWAAEGDLDLSFGDQGVALIESTDVAYAEPTGPLVQADGRIVTCGIGLSTDGTHYAGFLSRINRDGPPDTSFGDLGRVELHGWFTSRFCTGLALQPDGKIVVVQGASVNGTIPQDFETRIDRFNTDGSWDTDFGTDGVALVNALVDAPDTAAAVTLQPDGAIVLALSLYPNRIGIVRLLADGSRDDSFGVDGLVTIEFPLDWDSAADVRSVLIDARGRILVAGSIDADTQGTVEFVAARVLHDGSVDQSFGSDGIATIDFGGRYCYPFTAMLQGDGRIVLAGTAEVPGQVMQGESNLNVAVARLREDGRLDTTFADGGTKVVAIDLVPRGTDFAKTGIVQRDGTIVLAGFTETEPVSSKAFMMELAANGDPVTGFGANGTRIFDAVPGERNGQAFIGIAMQGSDYVLLGSVNRDLPVMSADFVVRVEGPRLLGHSVHRRPQHAAPARADVR